MIGLGGLIFVGTNGFKYGGDSSSPSNVAANQDNDLK
jgi:hypothetical protein